MKTPKIGDQFKIEAITGIRINSNGSGVYNSHVTPGDEFKIEKINSKSVYCSALNLLYRGFGKQFKGFIFPIETVIKLLNG